MQVDDIYTQRCSTCVRHALTRNDLGCHANGRNGEAHTACWSIKLPDQGCQCWNAGPVLYIVTWIVAGLLYPGYNQLTQATSELTAKAASPAAVANFRGWHSNCSSLPLESFLAS